MFGNFPHVRGLSTVFGLSIPAFWPEFLFSVFPISDLSLYFYFQLFQPMKCEATISSGQLFRFQLFAFCFDGYCFKRVRDFLNVKMPLGLGPRLFTTTLRPSVWCRARRGWIYV
jgi:hypothetical protein